MKLDRFQVGELYTAEEIQVSLGVGNAGGIRISRGDGVAVRRVVIMTSTPSARQITENPYHDRIEGDTLIYTGAGKEGDQTLAGPNKRLAQQLDERFPIYAFLLIGSRRDQAIGPRRWRFIGLLRYLRSYLDSQIDTRGATRSVWVFEFSISTDPVTVPLDADRAVTEQLLDRPIAVEADGGDEQIAEGSQEDLALTANRAAIEAIRSRLLAIEARAFEHLIKDVLERSGFEQVAVTKFSQDGGIDVNAYASRVMWPLNGLMVQIQAKRWLHTVGRREVAELRGSLLPHSRGAIVTTSYYSRAALREAADAGKAPIVLVDGHAFARLVGDFGVDLHRYGD